MEYTVTVDGGAQAAALDRAVAIYNERNTPPLTAHALLQRIVSGQLDALVQSHLKTKIRPLDFLQRFTLEERSAIRTAAKSSPAIDDYLQMLAAVGAGELDLTHPLTAGGVQALEAAGLIAAGRAAQILAL